MYISYIYLLGYYRNYSTLSTYFKSVEFSVSRVYVLFFQESSSKLGNKRKVSGEKGAEMILGYE